VKEIEQALIWSYDDHNTKASSARPRPPKIARTTATPAAVPRNGPSSGAQQIARISSGCDVAGLPTGPHSRTPQSPMLAKLPDPPPGASAITFQKLGRGRVMGVKPSIERHP